MSLLIKICGLKSADDVIAAVDAGADAIGFVFAESRRRVTPTQAAVAASAAPEGVLRVAVMLHPGNDQWLGVLESFRPDILQTDHDDFAALDVPADVERWPVFREGQVPEGEPLPRTFLYEGATSGSGRTVDWEHAAGVASRGRMVLAGGLDRYNVAEAVLAVRPFGVDVSSGVESAPGEKDPERMRDFVMAARAAEQHL